MSEVSWNGRIYVDEPQITPEQYKIFFGRYEFGISFNTANSILRNRQNGDLDEVVPADELNDEAKDQIKDDAMYGSTSGEIEYAGQTLNWSWDYEIIKDDEEVSWDDMEDYEKEKILTDMLDNECRCGSW